MNPLSPPHTPTFSLPATCLTRTILESVLIWKPDEYWLISEVVMCRAQPVDLGEAREGERKEFVLLPPAIIPVCYIYL